ncbi:MAG TPA: ParB/RepB/Spo0J family partition protein [Bosea sp. (in: a-proteobacteria)]|jgi:ParB family chromosome partitioning protein|uniref:ParB/RepB/Spo0J family partition protein n=1 Tax=Bosea sp. (in: a-proteobacteria) TaxID=1871050 RepID=UPI002DDD5FD6|nr:ParB/RepB/Spo0J family partition protein [Bosea sp. (in: a-proteobacteria)]HEV2556849.1 ParB/RepB/Spo0J family partition protein [Bosea sp. (in: a-proteobacteria)]
MSLLANLTAGSPMFLAELATIDVSDRLRPVTEANAQLTAASISELGQLQPIIVRVHPTGNGLKLIAGGRRCAATALLGRKEILAVLVECNDDEARMIEIDENLAREELNPLDRAFFLAERKRVYEVLNPQAAHGKAKKPKTDAGKVANIATFARFSKDAAKATGLSERSVQLACALAAALSPDAVALIRGTKLADNQAQLQALAALDPAEQVTAAREVAEGRASNVAKARVSAGLVPAGAVRPEDGPLVKLEALLARMTPGQLRDALAMVQAKVAAADAAQKPKASRRGAAA